MVPENEVLAQRSAQSSEGGGKPIDQLNLIDQITGEQEQIGLHGDGPITNRFKIGTRDRSREVCIGDMDNRKSVPFFRKA